MFLFCHTKKGLHLFLFLFRFNTALSTMASRLATTIPFEKNIWKAVGMLTKRLLLLSPTPAAIETAAIRKLCSLLAKSTRARICIPWRETKPNITSMAPPRTGLGMIWARAPNLGRSPRRTRNQRSRLAGSLDTWQFNQPNVLWKSCIREGVKIPPRRTAKPSAR